MNDQFYCDHCETMVSHNASCSYAGCVRFDPRVGDMDSEFMLDDPEDIDRLTEVDYDSFEEEQ